jgi:hypothetical protein
MWAPATTLQGPAPAPGSTRWAPGNTRWAQGAIWRFIVGGERDHFIVWWFDILKLKGRMFVNNVLLDNVCVPIGAPLIPTAINATLISIWHAASPAGAASLAGAAVLAGAASLAQQVLQVWSSLRQQVLQVWNGLKPHTLNLQWSSYIIFMSWQEAWK